MSLFWEKHLNDARSRVKLSDIRTYMHSHIICTYNSGVVVVMERYFAKKINFDSIYFRTEINSVFLTNSKRIICFISTQRVITRCLGWIYTGFVFKVCGIFALFHLKYEYKCILERYFAIFFFFDSIYFRTEINSVILLNSKRIICFVSTQKAIMRCLGWIYLCFEFKVCCIFHLHHQNVTINAFGLDILWTYFQLWHHTFLYWGRYRISNQLQTNSVLHINPKCYHEMSQLNLCACWIQNVRYFGFISPKIII